MSTNTILSPHSDSIIPHRWDYDDTVTPSGIWLPRETIPRQSAPRQTIWNILVVTGDPSANGNRFDREIAYIRDALHLGITMIERSSISVQALAAHLHEDPPTVLHICAHTSNGQLALHNDGDISWVSFEILAEALLHREAPLLLVLNMCRCAALADLLREWATTTVHWIDPLEDDAARSFSGSFYKALQAGASVAAAVADAKADSPQLLTQAPRINGNEDLVLTPRARTI